MPVSKTLAAFASAAIMTVGAAGLAACAEDEDGDGAELDEEIDEIDEGVEDGVDEVEEELDEAEEEVED